MKKEKSVLNIIDYITDKTLGVLKKLGRLISNKKSHDTIEIFIKIIITLILLAFMKIPFMFLEQFGTITIYTIGSTFRMILSTTWVIFLKLAYLLFDFVVLLKVFKSILSNKELNFIEDNRRKDASVKKKIFNPLIKLMKVCLYLALIPLVFAYLTVIVIIGMNIAMLVKGYTLISLFLVLIGIAVMIISGISAILSIVNGGKNNE